MGQEFHTGKAEFARSIYSLITGRKVATYACYQYVTDSQLAAKNKNVKRDDIMKVYRPIQFTCNVSPIPVPYRRFHEKFVEIFVETAI